MGGFQRKFEKGDIFTKYKNFMGYTCVDGEMVIVPEEAEVVRRIFELYLKGLSFGQIKAYLEAMDIKQLLAMNIGMHLPFRKCFRMKSIREIQDYKRHIQKIL